MSLVPVSGKKAKGRGKGVEEGKELPVVRGVTAGGTATEAHVSLALLRAPALFEARCSNQDILFKVHNRFPLH